MISIQAILAIISALGVTGAVALLVRGIRNWYANKMKEDAANDELRKALEKTQEWANRPRSDNNVLDRLRNPKNK
jgi:hypothetical protein